MNCIIIILYLAFCSCIRVAACLPMFFPNKTNINKHKEFDLLLHYLQYNCFMLLEIGKGYCYRPHWLPIRQRIKHKLGVLVCKCLRGDAPSYLTDMISPVGNGSKRLRSAAHGDLAVPRTRTVRMGSRGFAVSGPTLWNSLPVELKTVHWKSLNRNSKLICL